MNTSWLLVWPIVVPLLTAALCLVAWAAPKAQRWISLLGSIVLLGGAIALFRRVWDGGTASAQMGEWAAPFGITVVADPFSGILVLLTALVGLFVVIYSIGDVGREREVVGFHPLFHGLLTGVGGSFVTGDIFNLYVWFEVMVIASFGLIALGGLRTQIDGAVKYVILNLVATAVLLAAIGLLYGATGTLNMADLGQVVPEHPNRGLIIVIASLFLLAFGMKAAVFPLYFWLPASYHTPTAAVSAIFAALLTKVGVYAMIRVFTLIFVVAQDFAYSVILVVGALTMLVGVLGAIAQSDLRRVLSFNLVSGIGFILIGVGLGTAFALSGAIFYTVHHIVVMSALFMAIGLIQRLGGESGLDRLDGFYVKEPLIALLFFVAAMSLAGVPPLSGFWPKVILVRSSLELEAYGVAAATLVTGLLTLYSMAKVWSLAFWRDASAAGEVPLAPRNAVSAEGAPGNGERRLLIIPVAAMAGLTLVLGLWAQPLLSVAERAAAELISPQNYIATVLELEGER